MVFRKWWGLLIGIGILTTTGVVAQADADYDQALRSASQGISLDNIFIPGTTSNNQAAVVEATNPAITGTQAAKVTNGKKQFGALWSTSNNFFQLNKNQSASMWLYFGNTGKKAADGMALVFQNDHRDLAATPSFGKTVSGETLGVWGVDTDKRQKTSEKLAQSAIQNSWALEFDTHLNASTNYGNAGAADSFDVGVKGPHIASNYPGDQETYEMQRTSTLLPIYSVGYYATQIHKGLISGDYTLLASGAWHHLSLVWQANTQQMTYTFDDKNPVTGMNQVGRSATVQLDRKKIDPDDSGQIRWGFTGATGDSYENNLVVFEEVPGLVDAEATATLTNLATGKVLADGEALKSRDPFKLTYQLSYVAGKQSWKDVIAELNLPQNLTYERATITYADGSSHQISLAGLSEQTLSYQLTKALFDENATATISLSGVAADVDVSTPVPAVGSAFKAVNGVVTTATPAVTINPKFDLHLLSLSGNSQTVKPGVDGLVNAQVVIPDGVHLKNTDITVHPQLNGIALPDFQIPAGADNSSGQFTMTVPAKSLKAGDNQLILTVEDPYGNVSNTMAHQLTVSRQLVFQSVAEASTFRDVTLTGESQRVKRSGDWRVQVLDTREAGAKWTVQVTSTPFQTATGGRLAGTLSYYDENGPTVINEVPVTVGQGTAADTDVVTDVAADWNEDQGLLLEINSGAAEGTYEGTVTWTLNDVP
ncbi:lectin-like domain-containing protein [Levilactobacillus yonginensis]|uniref:lectin-like domain-containing protein n=1 Tax=Levilactobacillus yonginensis TaxID=1054041 RepID=UPI00345CE6CA